MDERPDHSGVPDAAHLSAVPRIVVGIDGSAPSRRALGWAASEARLRGAVLHVLHFATYPVGFGPVIYPAVQLQTISAAARDWADAEVTEVLGSDPGVEVRLEGAVGLPARGLLEAARGAQLLVVGHRGGGGFAGLSLGSVSQQCAHHAPCPVAVVRDDRAGAAAPEEA